MAFDITTAKPASSGGFDLSTAQPQPEQPRTRRERRESKRAARPPVRDPFEGLPADITADIESRFPLPEVTGERSRAGSGRGSVINDRRQAAELEQIRLINPYLAEQIEETGGLEAFAVGAGRGLTNIGRAVGLADPESDIERQAIEGLKTQTGAVTAGEIVGESAPFLAVGGPLTGLAKTVGQRAIAGAALGATEGGLVTKGRGGSAKQIALGTLLGGVTGGALPVAGAGVGRFSGSRGERIAAANTLLKEPTAKEIAEAVQAAAPTPTQLRQASKSIYDQVRDLGADIKPDTFSSFAGSVRKEALDIGLDIPAAGRSLTPEAQTVFSRLEGLTDGSPVTVDALERVRRSAQNASSVASRAGNNADASVNNLIVDNIDGFLQKIDKKDFTGDVTNIGGELAAARKLWGKARKSELLDEALEKAGGQASGIENGIRIQFRQIINNKKKSRFFTAEEKEAMKNVVQGTASANTFKRIGKLGFGSGQQTNVLSGLAGAGVGSTSLSAMFGPIGAGIGLVILPTAGTISKRLAENLTKKSASMANQLVRAGENANNIAKVYLRNTPLKQRSADDLASLLMRPDLNLTAIKSSTPIIAEAATKATQLRQSIAASSGALAIPAAAQEEK